MKKILVKKSSNFTTINNEFIFKKEMSLKAKGLLCHLLALPEKWDLYVEEVEKWHKDGKKAIYSAFKELSELGYLERSQTRKNGKIVKWHYIIYEKPLSQKVDVENVQVENLQVQNEPLIKTNSIKYLNKSNTKKKGEFEFEHLEELNVEAWKMWRAYRKETFRLTYKPIGEKAAVGKLMRLSQGCHKVQEQIIQQSIENGWKGIFEMKKVKQSAVKTTLQSWQEATQIINGQN